MQHQQRTPKTAQIERTKGLVLQATADLMLEEGYRVLTVEKISTRSGVARSSIYRYWDGVPDVAIEAIEAALGPTHTTPYKDNVRDTLVAHYRRYVEILSSDERGRLLPSLIEAAHYDSRFRQLFETLIVRRTLATANIVEDAKQNGDLPQETHSDWIIDFIGGALHHRLLVTGASIAEPGYVEWLVDSALSTQRAASA